MAYLVNGGDLEADDQGYLVEPDHSEEAAKQGCKIAGLPQPLRKGGY